MTINEMIETLSDSTEHPTTVTIDELIVLLQQARDVLGGDDEAGNTEIFLSPTTDFHNSPMLMGADGKVFMAPGSRLFTKK